MSIMSSFKSIKNNRNVYRNKDFMKKFCESLREYTIKIINFKKKKMKLLAKEQKESYENAKTCYICREIFENKCVKDKKYRTVRNHCTGKYRGAAHRLCNLKYSLPNIVFHNGSSYDYHFITKKLAEEFKKQLTCLGENTEKYITFTVPIENQVTRIDKSGEKISKNISYILQFIDGTRFMASSLSSLVNNLSEGIHRVKCKYGRDDATMKLVELNVSITTVFLNKQILKMN